MFPIDYVCQKEKRKDVFFRRTGVLDHILDMETPTGRWMACRPGGEGDDGVETRDREMTGGPLEGVRTMSQPKMIWTGGAGAGCEVGADASVEVITTGCRC